MISTRLAALKNAQTPKTANKFFDESESKFLSAFAGKDTRNSRELYLSINGLFCKINSGLISVSEAESLFNEKLESAIKVN